MFLPDMSKVVTAEYDPETKTLTLNERLEGVRSDGEVKVRMPASSRLPDHEERLAALRKVENSISDPSFFDAVDEMFPPWNDPDDL
jgi:hypothetical protein